MLKVKDARGGGMAVLKTHLVQIEQPMQQLWGCNNDSNPSKQQDAKCSFPDDVALLHAIVREEAPYPNQATAG